MKASDAKLLEFLKKSPQFVIPIYQRSYSWTETQCRQLWNDVLRAGGNDKVGAHFVGSIVYIQQDDYQVSNLSPLLVIDGQQRLTTLTLLLAALVAQLSKLSSDASEPVPGFSPAKISGYYLLNSLETGERRYKLLLSQTDSATLKALVDNLPMPTGAALSLRVSENYALFQQLLESNAADMASVCKGIAKLMVVDVALSRGQDNPQLIFESMNSTGKELSQADLIRNFVLMGLEPALQTRLYDQFWRPMELDFGQEAYGDHFDSFMRHYLTTKSSEIPRLDEVYEVFKRHAQNVHAEEKNVENLVKEIRDFGRYFCAMALGAETNPELKLAFQDLKELKVDVANPFLLELYRDYDNGLLSVADFVAAVRLIEAYVFRRAVCAIPTNSMNKTFANFSKSLKKDRYLESIKAHFLTLPSYRRFPADDEFKRDAQTRDLYKFGGRGSYWLRRLENHGRKERVPVSEYTIEHILPQNENLSAAWKTALGAEWQRIQATWLHTLGNLTLTGYNSEYSDRPFAEKRDMTGGFKESPLKVNAGLGALPDWTEQQIKDRAERLATTFVGVWPMPALAPDILTAYNSNDKQSAYSLEDHPNLMQAPLQEVFEAFRKEVKALDPCVTEEFLKLYVAYKAETNFVDAVPQSKRLRLSLNMRFADIVDSKGICKDVTGVGRWGNGDVEVGLSTLEELPYIMSLVRQSFEWQMGAVTA